MADRLSIATLNCEGIRRSTDYIRNYLSIHNCDILCLQETWQLDDNIQYFNKIQTDYFIDTTCTDYKDCITKKSHFIGYVNKLKVNFGKMAHNVLIN